MNHPINQNEAVQAISSYQVMAFLCCWLAGIFAGMNATIFSLMIPQALPDILQTTDRGMISQIGSYILSIFLMGWMLGGIFFGVIGDRVGRVKAMVISIGLYALSTGLAGLTTAYWQLLIYRFLTGLGIGGAMLSLSIVVSEVWPSHSRAIAIGAVITSYQVGVFLSGVIAHLFSEWRMVFGIGTLPVLLAFLIAFILHEPQAWKEAFKESKSEKNHPLKAFVDHVKHVFQSNYRSHLLVGGLAFGGLLVGYWASISWVPAWIQDLVGSSSGQEKNLATMYHGIAAMTGCVMAGYLADRWGRIPIILISFIGAFVVSSWMFLTNQIFSSAIYFQYGLLGLFLGIAQAVMYIYLPELFPIPIRATAVGLCLNCGRLVTAILVIFVGVFVTLLGGYSHTLFAFSCIYLVGAAAVLKNTRERT